jgi:hypothetical protein
MAAQNGKTLIQQAARAFYETNAAAKLREIHNTTSTEIAVRDTTLGIGALMTWVYYVVSNTRDTANANIKNYNNRHNDPATEEIKYDLVKDAAIWNIFAGTAVASVWPAYWAYRGISWTINKTV